MAAEHTGTDGDRSPTGVVASVTTTATLVAAFGLLAVGWPHFWILFPIGFGGVLPAATAIAVWYEAKDQQPVAVRETEAGAKLASVREQYARGEIDDATLETRVERLLETESGEETERFDGEEKREGGLDRKRNR